MKNKFTYVWLLSLCMALAGHEGALAQVDPARQLAIPMRAGNRSLNLANSVALVVFEAWRQIGFPTSP